MAKTAKQQLIADAFNEKFPIGSKVRWRPTLSTEGYGEYISASKAWVADSGTPVVRLEGKSGYVSIDEGFLHWNPEQLED